MARRNDSPLSSQSTIRALAVRSIDATCDENSSLADCSTNFRIVRQCCKNSVSRVDSNCRSSRKAQSTHCSDSFVPNSQAGRIFRQVGNEQGRAAWLNGCSSGASGKRVSISEEEAIALVSRWSAIVRPPSHYQPYGIPISNLI